MLIFQCIYPRIAFYIITAITAGKLQTTSFRIQLSFYTTQQKKKHKPLCFKQYLKFCHRRPLHMCMLHTIFGLEFGVSALREKRDCLVGAIKISVHIVEKRVQYASAHTTALYDAKHQS